MDAKGNPSLGPADVVAAIYTCQTALTTKIESFQLHIGLFHYNLDKIRFPSATVEQTLDHVEDLGVRF